MVIIKFALIVFEIGLKICINKNSYQMNNDALKEKCKKKSLKFFVYVIIFEVLNTGDALPSRNSTQRNVEC